MRVAERSHGLRNYQEGEVDHHLLSRAVVSTGIKGHPFIPVGGSNRDKKPLSPAGPVSRWTRDKNHILFRAQKQPEQMVWKKKTILY